MEPVLTFTVDPAERGQRLDAFLGGRTEFSRSRLKKAVQEGRCQVDGQLCAAPDTRLVPGQVVHLCPPAGASVLTPEQGEVPLVYKDASLAVVNKPAGLTVHPCPSCPQGTLVQRLLSLFPALAAQEGLRPGIVHRLDKETSGLLVVALTEPVRLKLSAAFANRSIRKTYLALVRGVPPARGHVDQPLGRHPTLKTRMAIVPEHQGGKPAFTEWRTLYPDPWGLFALLAVTIHTGRTHQIRVHLAHAGYPLWGDALYAPRDPGDPAPRQMLHAWKLAFAHPVSGEPLSFTCPPPADMEQTLITLASRTQRVILTGTPGCGKSTVLQSLAGRGLPTWSADAEVARLYAPGGDAWHMLRGLYGERFVPSPSAEGAELPVDRAALGKAFADDPELRREVERFVHPMVQTSLNAFFARSERPLRHGRADDVAAGADAALRKNGALPPLRGEGSMPAVAEVPLWHEAGMAVPGPAPVVVTVRCPLSVRHERLAAGRGWSAEKMAAVEAWQWSEEAKARVSALTVENSGDRQALEAEIEGLLRRLAALRREEETSLREHLRALWTA